MHDEKKYSRSVRDTMKYHTTSKQKQLIPNETTKNNWICAKKDLDATHVISEVTYGFNAFLMFEKAYDKTEQAKEIGGSLHVLIKKIPSFSIEGSASVDFVENQTDFKNSISFQFRGDTKLGNWQWDSTNAYLDGI